MSVEHLHNLRDMLIDGLQTKIQVMNYTFSWWEVLVFEIVMSILTYIIVGILIDD